MGCGHGQIQLEEFGLREKVLFSRSPDLMLCRVVIFCSPLKYRSLSMFPVPALPVYPFPAFPDSRIRQRFFLGPVCEGAGFLSEFVSGDGLGSFVFFCPLPGSASRWFSRSFSFGITRVHALVFLLVRPSSCLTSISGSIPLACMDLPLGVKYLAMVSFSP